MSNNSEKQVVVNSGGVGAGTIFLVLLVLKLAGVINWSWWIVTLPLWLPFLTVIGIILLIALIVTLAEN